MTAHLIPEHHFPMVLTPRIRVLGNYFFNLFLVTGSEKSALFEAGVSGVVDRVIRQLERLGAEPDYLVVSHPHADHITGLPGLMAAFPRARVVMAEGAVDFAAHPKAEPAHLKEDRFISRELERSGFRPGRPSLDTPPNLSRAEEIRRETHLDLGGGTGLTLIPVQGHSPGNLIARVDRDNALFCSDSLGFHYPGRAFWPLFFTNARDYLDTLEQIRRWEPAILCPAHQGPLTGEDAAAAPARAAKEARAMIRRIRESPLSDEALVEQLFEESYRDEFSLYTPTNIKNCTRLMLKRSRENFDL